MRKPSILLRLAAAWMILWLLLAGCTQTPAEDRSASGEEVLSSQQEAQQEGAGSSLAEGSPTESSSQTESSSSEVSSFSEVSSSPVESTPKEPEDTSILSQEADSEMTMQVQVNGSTFSAKLADTAAAQALASLLESGPLTLSLRDYGGFEKVGSLGQSLPTSDSQTTTQAGDIVLYLGNQIVMFYGSNSWSYTRLARVEDLTGWEEALGSGSVSVTLSLEG